MSFSERIDTSSFQFSRRWLISMRSEKPVCASNNPSVRCFPNFAFKTVPMSVGLAKDRSRLFREDIGTYLFLSEVACEACEE